MRFWEWAVIIAVVIGALVFTLAWWKIADRWADHEHKRFGRKTPAGDGPERIVLKNPGKTPPAA
jgi:hypothetical protein